MTVNVIGEDASSLLRRFAAGFVPGENALRGRQIAETECGIALARAVLRLVCDMPNVVPVGNHHFCLGPVAAGSCAFDARICPHYRRTALFY